MIDPAQKREDWRQIIAEIEAGGMTAAEISRTINVPESTLRNWKRGNEPLHYHGTALLNLHRARTMPVSPTAKLSATDLDLWGKKRP